jgi:hypothetical protein
MPRSRAASRSMEALRKAVEAISLKRGSRSRSPRASGVRSRMTQITSNGVRRAATASGSSRWSLKIVMAARPVSGDQSAISRATF